MPLVSFFDKAPSFKAREAHRYLNILLGIFRARGGGLLDHPYAPCPPPSATPTEKHLGITPCSFVVKKPKSVWIVIRHQRFSVS